MRQSSGEGCRGLAQEEWMSGQGSRQQGGQPGSWPGFQQLVNMSSAKFLPRSPMDSQSGSDLIHMHAPPTTLQMTCHRYIAAVILVLLGYLLLSFESQKVEVIFFFRSIIENTYGRKLSRWVVGISHSP